MPITKEDRLMIKRGGRLLRPSNPEYEELELIDYPVDVTSEERHAKPGDRILLLKVKSVTANPAASRGPVS